MEATVELERAERDELRQVLSWRSSQLRLGGFEPEDAALLAIHIEVDLHEALDLIRRGCPSTTALRILL
jgi:hypothetical protein